METNKMSSDMTQNSTSPTGITYNVTDPSGFEPEEKRHGLSDQQTLYIVMGILIFLSIVGTAGNALVLYVFSKKRDKLVSTLFILVLAFVDFLTCLVVIPYTVILEYINFRVKYDIFCKLYQFLITSNIPFSALIMVAIAIDRYFCICHPFLRALNITRAKIMTAAMALFSTVMGVVVALMYTVNIYLKKPSAVTMMNTNSTVNNTFTYATDNTATFVNTSQTNFLTGSESYNTFIVLNTTSKLNDASPNNDFENGNDGDDNDDDREYIVVNNGQCRPTNILFSWDFQWYYQKIYTGIFLLCLLIVIVLYTLIYKSVLERRTKRQKQKSKALHLVQTDTTGTVAVEETLITNANGEHHIADSSLSHHTNGSVIEAKEKDKMLKDFKKQQTKRKSTKRDKIRMANLKTAAMLFVVTVVFILTFLPALLMANKWLDYNMIIFYMYFANNVANPVIYSFMNKNFRDDLRKLFCSANGIWR